jgi:hypothetical protein
MGIGLFADVEESVYARCVDAAGRFGDVFRVNQTTDIEQGPQSVAMHADGRFMVAWCVDEAPSELRATRCSLVLCPTVTEILDERFERRTAPSDHVQGAAFGYLTTQLRVGVLLGLVLGEPSGEQLLGFPGRQPLG